MRASTLEEVVMKTNKLLISMMGFAALAMTACEKTDRSFSLLDAGSTFQQAATYVPRKIDVLWVIDNSGSMETSQTNLTKSFGSFISSFQEKQYDFHMAVTGTDAWRAQYQSNLTNKDVLAKARLGEINFTTNPLTWVTNSGVNIMDRTTPNLTQAFITNATQGILGTGDERAFSSFRNFLDYSGNSNFRRPDAILAIIIVSDEDDYSGNTSTPIIQPYRDEVNGDPIVLPFSSTASDIYNLYRDPRLDTVQSYKDYLDGLVGPGNYSVNMIGILDQQCKTELNSSIAGHRIGRRYMELADITGGVKTSLCANFGESLQLISDKIIRLNGVFKLDREPVVETLKVVVNGTEVPQAPVYGWSYDPATLTITFNHQDVIPKEGDNVQILFTPVRASN
jgi:hypothetical protein